MSVRRKAALAVNCAFLLASVAVFASSSNANPSSAGYTVANNTPGLTKTAQDVGAVNPSTVISITVWLDLQNQQQLDSLYQQQNTHGANYQKWITQTDFNAKFAPTAQQVNALTNYLQAKNLSVIATAENNFYVKVQGTVGDIEKAFHVQIDNYNLNGVTYRSNTGNPNVSGLTGAHVAAITGMDDYGYQPNAKIATDAEGNPAQIPISSANTTDGVFITRNCFPGASSASFSGNQGNPSLYANTASYSGNAYRVCGYGAKEMETAYNENGLLSAGLNGSGQTIVIVDAYGSDTIASDANVFSYYEGLPPITSSNFQVIKAPGLTNNPHDGWQGETTLDVEWAHAMAPGANIALVVATDRSSLDEAINLAVVRHLGNTISNSWSSLERLGNPATFDRVNHILEMAAVQGINVNFATGDYGDETSRVGFVDVDFPASSPFATAIGGTSLGLNADKSIAFQTGWGNNETRISDYATSAGQPAFLNPQHLGFIYGAGGGASYFYSQPAFQQGVVGGTQRMTPDISMLADPYTGAEIVETVNGQLVAEIYGGTSLATPMFSGIMAIAAQKAGHGFGQVAQYLYSLPSDAVYDVGGSALPGTNVTGSINGVPQSADSLVFSTNSNNPTSYYSALYHGATSRWYVLSFGTDSSLRTGPGWDNVTGVGTPNGEAFVDALASK